MAKRVRIDAFTAPAPERRAIGGLFDEEDEPMPKPTPGVARAWQNADDWWKSSAMQGLKALAASGRDFDAYDVAQLGVPEPDHANRWGALFRAARQQGLIVPVGYHESKRPGRASGSCRVWRGTASTIKARA